MIPNLEYIKKTLNDSKKESSRKFKADLIGIFGSYANGKNDRNSDLDVLVRFSGDATLLDFVALSDYLEKKIKIKVDVVPIDTLRNEIKEHVLRDAVYL